MKRSLRKTHFLISKLMLVIIVVLLMVFVFIRQDAERLEPPMKLSTIDFSNGGELA